MFPEGFGTNNVINKTYPGDRQQTKVHPFNNFRYALRLNGKRVDWYTRYSIRF